MNTEKDFYTLKGYQLKQLPELTSAMEDYLEMIYRMLSDAPENNDLSVVRVRDLARQLHVQPSSASKMVHHLEEAGYVRFPKYGYILPTEKGLHAGAFLLHRHKVLHSFFCALNQSSNELEQVEKIEHFISDTTLLHLERLTALLLSSDLWPVN